MKKWKNGFLKEGVQKIGISTAKKKERKKERKKKKSIDKTAGRQKVVH